MKIKEFFKRVVDVLSVGVLSLKKIQINDVLEAPKNIWNWFWDLGRNGKIALGIFLALIVLIPVLFFNNKQEIKDEQKNVRVVELVNVGAISNISSPLSLVGVVQSVNEATVRGESSGQLTRVYKKLGDRVYAGEIIAQFENSAERAAVLSAEGSLEQAKAARAISQINGSTSGSGLDTAKQNSLNTFSSTFATMEDVVRVKTDSAYTNPDKQELTFNVLVPNQVLIGSLENQRRNIEIMLTSRVLKNKSINLNSNLESELDILVGELGIIKNYLDDLAKAYSSSIPNQNSSQAQLDTAKSLVVAGRAQITGNIATALATKQALVVAGVGSQVSGISGNPTLAASDATVKIAQGAYYSALARLQKTIIRSPITGTINSLNIETGDYLVPSQEVAVVSNNGALEVTTYISSEDAKRVTVGQRAILNQKIGAVVVRVASAIDPKTKKIEVKLGIKDFDKNLVNGQSVKVEIVGLEMIKNNLVKVDNNQTIKVYLSSVKITPRGNFIFIVDEGNNLKAVSVTLGRVINDMVEITEGISPEMDVVRDGRGLKEGEKVEIKTEATIENKV
jgi:RND family efflux transporter MFP subunit